MPPAGAYSRRTSRGPRLEPRPTPRMPPKPSASSSSSSQTSTATPAASADSDRELRRTVSGDRSAGGVFTRSLRASHAGDDGAHAREAARRRASPCRMIRCTGDFGLRTVARRTRRRRAPAPSRSGRGRVGVVDGHGDGDRVDAGELPDGGARREAEAPRHPLDRPRPTTATTCGPSPWRGMRVNSSAAPVAPRRTSSGVDPVRRPRARAARDRPRRDGRRAARRRRRSPSTGSEERREFGDGHAGRSYVFALGIIRARPRSGGAAPAASVGWRHARSPLPLRAERRRPGAPRAAARRRADRVRRRRLRRRAVRPSTCSRRSTPRSWRRSTPTSCSTTARGVRSSSSSRTTSPTTGRRDSSLDLAHDELGQQFLLLTGYEPDFQWERFAVGRARTHRRARGVVDHLGHAIPMPVPHTRPIGMTVSGNRAELIEAMSIWRPHTQVPSNALHLVEYRLQEQGHPTTGFVLLVPHYLADTEYPAAAVAALEAISASTGGSSRPTCCARRAASSWPASTSRSPRTASCAKLVGTLEERHDSYMEGTTLRSPLTDEDGELPSRRRDRGRAREVPRLPPHARRRHPARRLTRVALGNAPWASRVVMKRGNDDGSRGSRGRSRGRMPVIMEAGPVLVCWSRHARAVQADLTWVFIVSENDRTESTSRRPDEGTRRATVGEVQRMATTKAATSAKSEAEKPAATRTTAAKSTAAKTTATKAAAAKHRGEDEGRRDQGERHEDRARRARRRRRPRRRAPRRRRPRRSRAARRRPAPRVTTSDEVERRASSNEVEVEVVVEDAASRARPPTTRHPTTDDDEDEARRGRAAPDRRARAARRRRRGRGAGLLERRSPARRPTRSRTT